MSSVIIIIIYRENLKRLQRHGIYLQNISIKIYVTILKRFAKNKMKAKLVSQNRNKVCSSKTQLQANYKSKKVRQFLSTLDMYGCCGSRRMEKNQATKLWSESRFLMGVSLSAEHQRYSSAHDGCGPSQPTEFECMVRPQIDDMSRVFVCSVNFDSRYVYQTLENAEIANFLVCDCSRDKR